MSYRKQQYVKAFSGNDDKKVAKTTIVPAPNHFTAWGDLGTQAKGQGWYPSAIGGDTTEFRNSYDNRFNQVVIPNDKQRGYISVVGGNTGNKLSVFIKKADGTIDRTLLKDVSPQDVDNYFRSQQGTIQKRADAIQAGTNSDRVINGNYTPLL